VSVSVSWFVTKIASGRSTARSEKNLLGRREPHRRGYRVALQVAIAGKVAFAALVLAHGADNGGRARVRCLHQRYAD